MGGGGGANENECGPCDKCDGKHATFKCPYFKKPRDKHKDAFEHYSGDHEHDEGSGGGGSGKGVFKRAVGTAATTASERDTRGGAARRRLLSLPLTLSWHARRKAWQPPRRRRRHPRHGGGLH